tara:strand:+ start:6082 stop:6435 length:354 start_codon:yes stop_codon:yes gene_type:complete
MNNKTPKSISPKELKEWLKDESKRPLLLDVREDNELEIAPFPFEVLHLPLSRISVWGKHVSHKLPLDKPLVVICHAGIRSLNFALWLLEQDFQNEIWNLNGGIDLWSVEVDSSVPRY